MVMPHRERSTAAVSSLREGRLGVWWMRLIGSCGSGEAGGPGVVAAGVFRRAERAF
jgi:hypothetical protein